MKNPFIFSCLLTAGFVFLTSGKINAQPEFPDNLLLKNYKPVSIYNVPVTYIPKARYAAIDMHSHDDMASNPAEIKRWIRDMDSAGIKKTILLTMAHGAAFDSIARIYEAYSDRFELWCGLDYTGYDKPGFGPAAVKELERCYKKGARGVGELGDKGKGLFYCKPRAWGMHPDDPRLDPVFRKCAELGMPVSLHVADPKWMYEKMDSTNDGLLNAAKWRIDVTEGVMNHEQMIAILENTLKRHPGTIFIVCHLANCCYDLRKAGELLDKHPNLYMDISARFSELAPTPRAATSFLTRYRDRIVYGTDMGISMKMYRITFRILESADEHFYAREFFTYHWPLHGFKLDDKVLSKIYYENAEKILHK
jgi:predicted TIM-barrel fold metal-dependent hydrolase